jgi:hypothetical protein
MNSSMAYPFNEFSTFMVQTPLNSATTWTISLQHINLLRWHFISWALTVLSDTPFSAHTTVYLHIHLLEGILVVVN